jgi:4'-phosphopantetheinyl transferase EntD
MRGVDVPRALALPPEVLVTVEPIRGDESDLLPSEARYVAGSVPRRRREFAAGRRCARALLAQLGECPQPLLPGRDRAPIWPTGIVGSIGHAGTWIAVAVARRGRILGVGIDVEPDEPLEQALWSEVLSPSELQRLRFVAAADRGRHARLLFSAKEALYKCIHAFAERDLAFREVGLAWRAGRLTASFPADVEACLPACSVLEAGAASDGGYLITGASLRVRDAHAAAAPTPFSALECAS